MSRLVRIVTAAVLTAHLMVGCCWHHAHACDGQDPCDSQDHSAQTSSMDAGLMFAGQCSESHDGGAGVDHQNHGPRSCQGDRCSFVAASFGVGNSLVQASWAVFIPLLDDHAAVGIGSERRFLAAGRFLPPVRLHLAHQVLLI